MYKRKLHLDSKLITLNNMSSFHSNIVSGEFMRNTATTPLQDESFNIENEMKTLNNYFQVLHYFLMSKNIITNLNDLKISPYFNDELMEVLGNISFYSISFEKFFLQHSEK